MKNLGYVVLAAALVACGDSAAPAGLGSSAAAVTLTPTQSTGPVEFVDTSFVLAGDMLSFDIPIEQGFYRNQLTSATRPNGDANLAKIWVTVDGCTASTELVPVATLSQGSGPAYVWHASMDVSACVGAGGSGLVVTHHCENGCAWDSCEGEAGGMSVADLQLWANNGPGNSTCTGTAPCQTAEDVEIGAGAQELWSGHWGRNVPEGECGYAHQPNRPEECPGERMDSPSCEGIWPVSAQ